MAGELDRSLFAVLFPGEEYDPAGGGSDRLADRLSEVADSLRARRGRCIGGPPPDPSPPAPSSRKKKKARNGGVLGGPDFTACPTVYVALKIAYLGWAYHGFARLKHLEATVEGKLFEALTRARLIPPGADPVADLRYSRCGRTDKGVSASGQVVALRLRAAHPGQPPLDYVNTINRHLPDDVRVLGSRECGEAFDARFGAKGRHYKYFFVQDGTLDLGRMAECARCFVGEHNFRNFCKTDESVRTYDRRVTACYIEAAGGEACASAGGPDGGLYAINVLGSAFLWHQVRCMASVLFSAARGDLGPPDVRRFLDLEAQPCRPSYTMAREEPLLLFRCAFGGEDGEAFSASENAKAKLREHLTAMLRGLRIRERLVRELVAEAAAVTGTGAFESGGPPPPGR